MWELVLAIGVILASITAFLLIFLRAFTSSVSQSTEHQAKVLISVMEPFLNPKPVEQPPEQPLPEIPQPEWSRVADSVDLIEDEGRMLTWDVPVIADEDSIGPEMFRT